MIPDAVVSKPSLTDPMREWLRANELVPMLVVDFIRLFRARFRLTPEQAGSLLAQWIRER